MKSTAERYTSKNYSIMKLSDMNYALAKELKDAGFPQMFKDGSFYAEKTADPLNMKEAILYFGIERQSGTSEDKLVASNCISIPSLSELIGACGDDFYQIETAPLSFWIARGANDGENYIEVRGETSEEAVARLWLALKKHV